MDMIQQESMDEGEEEERWSDLAPELLADVVRRVEQMPGEARRVVAMAGVCSTWRRQILAFYSRSRRRDHPGAGVEERPSGAIMQFPWMITRPGPRAPHQPPVQCFLKRKGTLFSLFQSENGSSLSHFLMAARRRRLPTGFSYIIGKDPRSLVNKEGVDVLGKLKSNFWATEFVLWQRQQAHEDEEGGAIPVVSLRFVEHIVNGIRQRRIKCALQPACSNPGPGLTSVVEKMRKERRMVTGCVKSWIKCNCISYHSCKGDTSASCNRRNYSSSRMLEIAAARSSNAGARDVAAIAGAAAAVVQYDYSSSLSQLEDEEDDDLELRSKIPVWDAQQQCWSLDFKGRATMPSMHNFQLIRPELSVDNIILQLGKIGKNSYTMDFCAPLSAFQAFAICLSSFATVALEP